MKRFTEKQLKELTDKYLEKHGLKKSIASPEFCYNLGFYEAVEFFKQFLVKK